MKTRMAITRQEFILQFDAQPIIQMAKEIQRELAEYRGNQHFPNRRRVSSHLAFILPFLEADSPLFKDIHTFADYRERYHDNYAVLRRLVYELIDDGVIDWDACWNRCDEGSRG